MLKNFQENVQKFSEACERFVSILCFFGLITFSRESMAFMYGRLTSEIMSVWPFSKLNNNVYLTVISCQVLTFDV